tara:strand:+ start:3646 stop:4164 length:519 start_codon:yes stop_codon:yes gene_type:complete
MIINKTYHLADYELDLISFVANQRQKNKIKTGYDGLKTLAPGHKSRLELNKMGFGAEYIFCKEMNLMPDFTIHNKRKSNNSDDFDAFWNGFSIDVKASGTKYPLRIRKDLKSNCQIFAYFKTFSKEFRSYKFIGFATNQMLFDSKNLKGDSYHFNNHQFISLKELKYKLNII